MKCLIYDFETLSQDMLNGVVVNIAAMNYTEERFTHDPYSYEELLDKCSVMKFDVKEQDLIDTFTEELTKVIEEEDVLRLRISQDVFNINTIFVVVHGLKSINGAKGFAELLDVKSNKLLARPYFAISSKNYKKLS